MLTHVSVFLFGLAIGSFLNVVIFRLEKDKLILSGRSKCPKCQAVLNWRDLVPLLSFVWQKGRCRYCGAKISRQYPVVEMATGLLFLSAVLIRQSAEKNPAYSDSLLAFMTIFDLIIISFLIVIFVYDLKHYLIPDKIVYPAIGISFLYFLAADYGSLPGRILAGFGTAVFFLLLVVVSRGRWMGLGDAKLSFLMGLWLGWPLVLAALLLSFFSGAGAGLVLIILGRKKMKSEIPFGPFLTGSTILVFLLAPFFKSILENLIAF